jgi:uncharacterized protein
MDEEELKQNDETEIGNWPHSIIDAHCHVASADFIPISFIEGAVSNVIAKLEAQGIPASRTRLMDLFLEKLQDPGCDELLVEMAAAGIDRCILLLPDFTYALPDTALTIAEMFCRHRDLLAERSTSFYVFAGVDPRWGPDAVTLFERGVTEYGFHGLKLYPPCGYSPSDRSLYPFYEICMHHGLPVLIHMGGTSPVLGFETARPILVDQAAHDFPGVNFILAHGSIAYTEECRMMCAFRPNVFMDISGFQTMPVERLVAVLESGINHKVIFGTDWPVFRIQGKQESFVASLRGERSPVPRLRLQDLESFFHGTITRLLRQRDMKQTSPPLADQGT